MVDEPKCDCPICGMSVKQSALERHIRMKHSSDKLENIIKALQQNGLNSQFIECPACLNIVRDFNFWSHAKRAHKLKIDPCFKPTGSRGKKKKRKQIDKNQERVNRFANEAEKEKFWRDTLGPDKDYSEDIMDRKNIKLGGGFGMGKNRKH